jgi:alkylresorcinol/alkylpyrone synthase
MRIAAVGSALPKNYYSQDELVTALKSLWAGRHYNLVRLEQVHRNALVGGRHLALRLEEYPALTSFAAANDRFIASAVELGRAAIDDGLRRAGLERSAIAHLFFVSVTGIATPSVDALLANRMRLRPELKRTPIFGLGCVAGAAGLARAADYLRAFPDEVAVLLSVELCSLTMQREDLSVANIIASGLFGDGAACVVLTGSQRGRHGPEILATRASFYPDTEEVMGWRITDSGFRVVLSASVPDVVRTHLRQDVERFLALHGLSRRDIGSWVCHPGGPRVLEAVASALELPEEALALSWRSLERLGNLSSASVLMVLKDTLEERRPPAGTLGLVMALGPGFCSELVLVRW